MASVQSDVQEFKQFIGGDWVAGGGGTFEDRDPFTDDVVGLAPAGNRGDAKKAIEAAAAAFPEWSQTVPAVRQAIFLMRVGRPDITFEEQLPEEPVFAEFDRRLVSQALTNVLKHAGPARARSPGPPRGVSGRRAGVGGDADPARLVVQVHVDVDLILPRCLDVAQVDRGPDVAGRDDIESRLGAAQGHRRGR